MLRATVGEPIPLQVLLPDGSETMFVYATVVDSEGTQVEFLRLPHLVKGLYSANWTPSTEGWFGTMYDVYLDEARFTAAGYERAGEQIEVSSDRYKLERMLGLQHENSIIDRQAYSSTGRLLSARVRAFETAAAAAAATDTSTEGLRYTWEVSASYNDKDQLTNYKILRSP